ncbi:HAD family hydrolase [Marinifilum caeruleilacunae]|uniref:phosphoglycolate phosphatase n=1 Tax=Marinifilum caeruleilacunae TaxID=2499076 RepID=A0ABX1WSK0_9BACT|nr:HAD hydrolase-like protein [Marinifilum caeruleilacunae]NOU59083.1 HAD family hydrolase [Marinifilum caeruleilacunae]
MKVDAVLWDYDGTLVNSVPKNIDTTKQIISLVAPRLSFDNLPVCLQSEEAYHIANHQAKNWQDLYVNYYGMTEEEMLKAGPLWTEFQLKNTTPVELFPDIRHTIHSIDLPQGICSQNSSENIIQVLKKNQISTKMNAVVGYDDVPDHMQKPKPYGGIKCLEQIYESLLDKTIVYVGDHEGDVEFARNIESELNHNSKVIAVTAMYSGANTRNWNYQPDFEISGPAELLEILKY